MLAASNWAWVDALDDIGNVLGLVATVVLFALAAAYVCWRGRRS